MSAFIYKKSEKTFKEYTCRFDYFFVYFLPLNNLDLQKMKNRTEFLFIFHQALLNVSILHCYDSFAKIKYLCHTIN